MKTGMILYVTQGKDRCRDREEGDTRALRRSLGVDALRVATSEDEFADAWWRLVTSGMHRVGCMRAHCTADGGRLEPMGPVMRLCG